MSKPLPGDVAGEQEPGVVGQARDHSDRESDLNCAFDPGCTGNDPTEFVNDHLIDEWNDNLPIDQVASLIHQAAHETQLTNITLRPSEIKLLALLRHTREFVEAQYMDGEL